MTESGLDEYGWVPAVEIERNGLHFYPPIFTGKEDHLSRVKSFADAWRRVRTHPQLDEAGVFELKVLGMLGKPAK